MKISVIVPCRNEAVYIKESLQTILGALEVTDSEILACDGASTDGTESHIRALAAQDPRVRYVPNPARYAPHGMNAGLRAATGTHLFIVSAHASYPVGYFRTLAEACDSLGAACTGGLLRTEVKADTPVARSIRAVLGDPFGVGNATFRTGAKHPCQVDTVAFGCYPRWVFERFGVYDERLIRNQDIELNKRIRAGGGTIWLLPEIQASYYARASLLPFLKNQFENGRWNILTMAFTGSVRSVSPRHLVPACFVLSLLLFAWVPFWPSIGIIPLATLSAYLPLALWKSIELRATGATVLRTWMVFMMLHLCYGTGSVLGLLQAPFLRTRRPR